MINDVATQKYYFDANALLKYYQDEQGSLQIHRLVSNEKPILVSPLTLVECVGVLMKAQRKNELKKRKLHKIIKDIERNTATEESTIRSFQAVAMPIEIFSLAKNILVHHAHTFAIGSNDALHLAILLTYNRQAIMVTSDKSMQKVCERLQIPFYDPEQNL